MALFRIALAQTCFAPRSIDEALERVDMLAGRAETRGAALLMLPEAFVCGYGNVETTRALATADGEPGFERLKDLARRHRVAIVCGYAERRGAALYNSAALLSPTGDVLLNARKMHLWGDFERKVFAAGERPAVVPLTPELRAGLLICYDLEHAVAVEDLARRGANLILAISATWTGYEIVPRAIVPARAYENAVFVAFCNHVGRISGIDYTGLSTVAAPDGTVIALAPADAETLLVANIDPAVPTVGRRPEPQHADRRTDLFPVPPET